MRLAYHTAARDERGPTNMSRRFLVLWFTCPAVLPLIAACREEPTPSATSQVVDAEIKDPIRKRSDAPEILFPDTVRTTDASLNQFIDNLLRACVEGEYGLYRLAVGSQYEPLNRRNFERAWHAVKEVRLRKIERVHEPTTRQIDPARTDIRPELKGTIYCAHATITLREDRKNKPVREVVVLIIQEDGQWKLGPPASQALKRRIMGTDSPAADLVDIPDRKTDPAESGSATAPSSRKS